jgi:hypothetical protein
LCALPLTDSDGAGPRCDHCLLYCTRPDFSSVDCDCPEGCGDILPAGWRPSCLSAEKLRAQYMRTNRRGAVARAQRVGSELAAGRRARATLSSFNHMVTVAHLGMTLRRLRRRRTYAAADSLILTDQI